MPATPADAKGLLKSAIRDDNPVVFIEGEMLYNMKGEVPDGEHLVPFGKADVKRAGRRRDDHLPLEDGELALKAAEQLATEEVDAEVVDLRTIRPLDIEAMLDVGGQDPPVRRRRGRLAVRGRRRAGGGHHPARGLRRARRPILRVTGADVPMPYNKQLEKAAKVDPAKVVAAVHEVLYRD